MIRRGAHRLVGDGLSACGHCHCFFLPCLREALQSAKTAKLSASVNLCRFRVRLRGSRPFNRLSTSG